MKHIVRLSWFAALFAAISSSPLMSRIPPQATCVAESCGTSNDKLKNAHITCSPDPPQVNEKITVYISGILTEQVDAGEVREKAFFGTRVISEKTYDLCNLQSFWNMSCPLHPGPIEVATLGHRFPPTILPGEYGALLNATDDNHNILFCFKAFCSVY
ncbi:putative phosphatidylglycerol/phosphatidylinositol transfer protein DDB_G0282107 [Dysidea avara]|uniref:putative phosphatidylglycerol/phosphatidylinositol transfer protein DDB_G0282107 n=1 Tax=Dysidea avara TaxID=196820 RepID=UPI00331B5511